MSINPMFLQKQLRENAANLEDFSKDLKNWSEEMKKKENFTGQQSASQKRKIKKEVFNDEPLANPKKSVSKFGSTDYAAWDKFDVDAELEKLEDDINDDSELTEECSNSVYDEAILEKEKGNKFVKIQKWDEAIKCYSKAIKCYSYDPIFYANRALCYLKKEMYEAVENDCNLSLKLDPTYVKALLRRAAARIKLQKFEHAEADLLSVLEYEPKNMESLKQLQDLRNKTNKREENVLDQRPMSKFTASRSKSKNIVTHTSDIIQENLKISSDTQKTHIGNVEQFSSWPMQHDIISVKSINKQPHLRSHKPLMRIEIEEINNNGDRVEDSLFKQIVEEKESNKPCIETAWPKSKNQPYSINSDDLKIIEKKNPKEEKNNSNNILINKTNEKTTVSNWETPKTSVQFYLCWNNLKQSADKYKYLKSINPEDLPKIFLNSMESAVFSKILEVLAQNCTENKDPVATILKNLTKIKRFSTIVMFMTDDDKKNLWKLFDHIKETNEFSNVDVDKLLQQFELYNISKQK